MTTAQAIHHCHAGRTRIPDKPSFGLAGDEAKRPYGSGMLTLANFVRYTLAIVVLSVAKHPYSDNERVRHSHALSRV